MSDETLDRQASSLEEGEPAHLASLLGHPATWADAPSFSVADLIAAASEPSPSAEPGPAPVSEPVADVIPLPVGRTRRQRFYRPVLAAAAALVLVAAITVGVLQTQVPPTATISLAGATGAPEAHGRIKVIERDAGWRLELDVQGLAPAAPGTYYQGWAIRDGDRVPLGTFHMHEAGKVELWSGVPLRQFRRIEVTRQDVGAGQDPGTLVLAGGM